MGKMIGYLAVCLLFLQPADVVEVQTSKGLVRGEVRLTEKSNKFYSFTGIPYAKPPIGTLRFKPPEDPEIWNDIFNATRHVVKCLQDRFSPVVEGDEDCLVLNVYTPSLSDCLPVMVFIHGGGFNGGTGSSVFIGEPFFLIDHNVVLVTINYRLGIFGFLSTEDKEAPGNYGLLDQVAALKWVKNNIKMFGGNPNKVTIFGQSAGAAGVNLLMLSPLAKGLFHGAISQSGSALNPWVLTHLSKKRAYDAAEKVGCGRETTSEILQCLRDKPAVELAEIKLVQKHEKYGLMPLVWVPRIDAEADQPFLPQQPIDLMISGEYNQVPWIIGQTKDEGASYINLDEIDYLFNNDWERICGISLNIIEFPTDKSLCNEIAKVKKHSNTDYISLLGNVWFTSGVNLAAELMSRHHSVYYYNFIYNTPDILLKETVTPGAHKLKDYVCHAHDVLYLFKHPTTTPNLADYKVIDTMTSLWTNFAKMGYSILPDGNTWPLHASPDYKYLEIDSEVSIKSNFRPLEMKYWKNVLGKTWYKAQRSYKEEL